MKYKTGWLLILAAALILPSFVWSLSTSAAHQDMESKVAETAKTPVDDSYVSPGNRHKIQVNDKAYAQALQKQGARIVAEYDGSAVVEVDSATAKELRKTGRGENRDDFNLVMLNAGYIDTSSPQGQELSLQSVGEVPNGKHMRLVQFASAIKPEWYDAMTGAGLEVITYMPSNAYLVFGDSKAMNRFNRFAQQSGVVQWQGSYHDAYKIDPAYYVEEKIREKNKQELAAQGQIASNVSLYAVQLYKNPALNANTFRVIDQIKDGAIKSTYDILKYTNIIVPLTPEDVKTLVAQPDVVVVEVYVTPKKRDERQNQIMAGNLTGNLPTTGGDWLAYLAGQGFTQAQFTSSNFAVNVTDSGIDNATTSPNHFGLRLLGNPASASRVIYNRLEGTPNGGSTLQGCDGHGTLNTHIVAGYVPTGAPFNAFPHADASGFRYGIGVAPFVKVGSTVIFDPDSFTFPNFTAIESKGYNDGARISTNSWGAAVGGAYNTDAQAYDALVRDAQPSGAPFPAAGNQEMVIVFSAGNSGSGANTIGAPGTGKNILSVGAAENVQAFGGADGCGVADTGADNANDIIGFSSRGPCDDGRIKPDIQAPGTHVSGGVFQNTNVTPVSGNGAANACFTADGVCGGPAPGFNFFPLGQQWYSASSGTSHSCPATAGAAALVRQRFINASLAVPSPAMTKAVLMGTARYMTGVSANDNLFSNNQGMGEVNLNNVWSVFSTPTILRDQIAGDMFTASGQTRIFTGNIADNTKPFIVALAYTDAPGPTSGNAFVNNLDLEVTVGGSTFKGNVFTGANSSTGGVADIRNNTEFVKVPAGVTGPFVVTVRGTNIAGDGVPNVGGALDQDFALMVYNANAAALAVIAPAGATITAEGCAPANGALDPGEVVTVSLCVQNVGTTNTTNLVGTLAASGGVTAPSGPQNYGVVVAGGPAVCRDFTFTASGACGSTITATLNLQDGASSLGSVTYTFTLGTLSTAFTENFDGVTAPALPAGWVTSFTNGDGDCTAGGALCALGSNWTTVTSTPDTAPNSAFHNDPTCVTDNFLETPSISITSAASQITFRNRFNVEDTFDGGVLEVSSPNINGGAYTDITNVAVGGSFVTGGYTDTINTGTTDFFSPLRGRQAWSGNSAGFITTTANLGPNVNGQTIKLRFRFASDCSVGVAAGGWNVDTISITSGFTCCGGGGGGDCVVTCPANVTVSNDPNQCGAVVNYPPPTTTGSCGTITCTPPSGSFFPVGTTTVTCSDSGGGGRPTGACTPQTITQSTSQAITPLNSVSCNSIDGHTDNRYFRAFTLSSFGITNAFDITSIQIGVEEATSGGAVSGAKARSISKSKKGKSIGGRPAGGGQPITVNLYTSSMAFPAGYPGSLTLIGTAAVNVADQSGTILTVPITATAPAGSQLVLEVFTPNGETAGNFFFIGSNAGGQTGPSYLLAADCGITVPTDTAAIGFPGMHIVMNVTGCQQAGGTGPSCTFTVTVNDTQPPTITCPANVTAVAAPTCPASGTTTVTYPPPTASDNCPGVTVACVPPSGSVFPAGTTTVTCTATDASGNTATCSFTVRIFNVCVQDRSNPNAVLAWNTATGEYVFCCNGTTFSGVGKARTLGCTYTLEHTTAADRRVTGKVDFTTFRGEGALQSPIGTVRCTISDNDVRDNNCACLGGPAPVSSTK